MAVSKIGHKAPDDMGAFIDTTSHEDAGMNYVMYESIDDAGIIITAEHESVGLVTYYRATSQDAAEAWVGW